MAKRFNRLAALALLCVVAVGTAGCSLGKLEKPEWLAQAMCDHVYDDEIVLSEATCVNKGKAIKVCSDCGKTETVVIQATGEHVWDEEVGREPTCGDKGFIEKTCSDCGKTETVVIQATGEHVWDEEVLREPTCRITGTLKKTCSVCDETETVIIPATWEHVWDEVVLNEVTCGDKGLIERTCSVCDWTETVVIQATLEHSWDEGVYSNDLLIKTCTVCGEKDGCSHLNVELVGSEDVEIGTCYTCGRSLIDIITAPLDSGAQETGWYRFDYSVYEEGRSDEINELNIYGHVYVEDFEAYLLIQLRDITPNDEEIVFGMVCNETWHIDGWVYEMTASVEMKQFRVDDYLYFYIDSDAEVEIYLDVYEDGSYDDEGLEKAEQPEHESGYYNGIISKDTLFRSSSFEFFEKLVA